MNIPSLTLELIQQLAATNDSDVLTKVKQLLNLSRAQQGRKNTEREEELMVAASLFGTTAYGDDEADISDLELKEPNPNYGE